MSILADKTAYKVFKIMTKFLKTLEEINDLNLKVTKIDDFEISLATNMPKSVIDNNAQVINLTSTG